MSIIQRIFKKAKDELAKQVKFNISSLNYYVNWETQESIGDKYGMGRKAVAKSIELLVEVEAIAIKEVRQKGKAKEIKNVYSKFADKDKLDMYVADQLENGEYTKVNDKVKAVVKETVQEIDPVVEEVVEVADEQLQTLTSNNTDEVVRELTEQVETVDTVEKKEDKQKVININDDERIKRMQALASFENVEKNKKSDTSVDLLAGHRPEKSAEA